MQNTQQSSKNIWGHLADQAFNAKIALAGCCLTFAAYKIVHTSMKDIGGALLNNLHHVKLMVVGVTVGAGTAYLARKVFKLDKEEAFKVSTRRVASAAVAVGLATLTVGVIAFYSPVYSFSTRVKFELWTMGLSPFTSMLNSGVTASLFGRVGYVLSGIVASAVGAALVSFKQDIEKGLDDGLEQAIHQVIPAPRAASST